MSRSGMVWYYLYCANCGKDQGRVLKTDLPSDFAFALCDDCAATYGGMVGTYMEPDHSFWEAVTQEQIDKYGRTLTAPEQAEVLKDGNSTLAKLARDFPDFTKLKL
jgi:hypothetical protein